jgi:hypothetical protein
MKKNIIAALVLTFGLTTATFADTKTPVINARQQNQQKRIAQGIRSGELTAKETVKLELNQKKIQHDKKEAKEDGVVTTRERIKLQKEENRASKRIFKAKHD